MPFDSLHLSRKTWIEALRNPEARQAFGVLMNSRGAMCCLGVGLVAAGVEHSKPHVEADYIFGEEEKWGMPSFSQMEILGISEPIARALAACNDNGATFGEIADFLETGNTDAFARCLVDDRHLETLKTYIPEGK